MTDQLQGERVAFREWEIGDDLSLLSTANKTEWKREMVAKCALKTDPFGAGDDHDAPNAGCGCGLYAFYVPPSLEGGQYASEPFVTGAVVVSGRTLLGPSGVRAEKARIVLLGYRNERQRVLAEAVAKKYGVGCCAHDDLATLALEYGQPVPDDEKPEQEGFAGGGVILGGSIALAANAVVTGNNLVGGGSAAIKNLRLGIPNGQSVEVDGSSGEVAVRVDGQEWIPGPDPKRETLAKEYRKDKITLPIVVLVALFCLATIPFGGGWPAVVIGLVWSLCAVGGAMCTKDDCRKLREYDAAKESS